MDVHLFLHYTWALYCKELKYGHYAYNYSHDLIARLQMKINHQVCQKYGNIIVFTDLHLQHNIRNKYEIAVVLSRIISLIKICWH